MKLWNAIVVGVVLVAGPAWAQEGAEQADAAEIAAVVAEIAELDREYLERAASLEAMRAQLESAEDAEAMLAELDQAAEQADALYARRLGKLREEVGSERVDQARGVLRTIRRGKSAWDRASDSKTVRDSDRKSISRSSSSSDSQSSSQSRSSSDRQSDSQSSSSSDRQSDSQRDSSRDSQRNASRDQQSDRARDASRDRQSDRQRVRDADEAEDRAADRRSARDRGVGRPPNSRGRPGTVDAGQSRGRADGASRGRPGWVGVRPGEVDALDAERAAARKQVEDEHRAKVTAMSSELLKSLMEAEGEGNEDAKKKTIEEFEAKTAEIDRWRDDELHELDKRYRDKEAAMKGRGQVTICWSPPGNPDNRRTKRVSRAAVEHFLDMGATLGPCGGDAGDAPGADVDDLVRGPSVIGSAGEPAPLPGTPEELLEEVIRRLPGLPGVMGSEDLFKNARIPRDAAEAGQMLERMRAQVTKELRELGG